jgi:hypothetical protein
MVSRRRLANLVRAAANSCGHAVSSAVGQMDLPFLVPVSPTGVHLTVQCVTPTRPQ